MTQENKKVPTVEEVNAAREFSIAHLKSLTEEHLAEIVYVMTDENHVKPAGITDLEFCLSLVMKMTDEEVVAYEAEVKENIAENEADAEQAQPKQEEKKPWTEIATPWATRVIKKISSLNKPIYISYLKLEEMREKDLEERARITAAIKALEEDEKVWEEKHKPFIMKVKGWDDTAPGTPAEAAARMALGTQKGVAAVTHWSGEQLVKLGNAMKRNSQATGKVVASPLFGIAHLISKKPKAPVAAKPKATEPAKPVATEPAQA